MTINSKKSKTNPENGHFTLILKGIFLASAQPPGANPLVAERAPWRSSRSRVTGGQQPI